MAGLASVSGRSESFDRFMASTTIDYEAWHDGVGYDLDALRAVEAATGGTSRRSLR